MAKHLRKITEFKVLKLVHFYMKIDILKLKKALASGGLRPPDPLTKGFAPRSHWGHCPQTPL